MRWDPQQYGRYASERARPFLDLAARIGATEPRAVVDLGCGPGTLTALLAQRWPSARVEGLDSSPEMIASAQRNLAPLQSDTPQGRLQRGQMSFALGDVRDWAPAPDVDVIISNATLQWVPGHEQLLARWAAALPAEGWLAFQVPGNFDAPSHTVLRELAAEPRWAAQLHGVLRHDAVATPAAYAEVLLGSGLQVDAWETTYLHVLPGPDPVLDWLRGTGLRPVLAALTADDAATFAAELGARLRVAYPRTPHGTLFPFRRIFTIGHRAG